MLGIALDRSEKIASFEDLEIWQAGMDLLVEVYAVVDSFPTSEKYGLSSQITRAAVSIPSNIAEGWGRGRGSAQAQFLKVARGSVYEVLTQLEAARRLGFTQDQRAHDLRERFVVLGKQINAYLSWLESTIVREEGAAYGTSPSDLT